VTARYEINKYTVVFVDHDGALLDSQTVNHGSGATAPPDPERECHVFTGWDKEYSSIIEALTIKAMYEAIAPDSVSLDVAPSAIYLDETQQLTATVLPSNALDKTVTWTSSDESVATVSPDGLVTPAMPGEVTITAETANGLTATCTIEVVSIVPDCVSLDVAEARLHPGEKLPLTATALPANARDKTVTWASGDESVATVSADGVVTAVATGEATITVETVNGLTAVCVITVPTVETLLEELRDALVDGLNHGLFGDAPGSYQSVSSFLKNVEQHIAKGNIANAVKQCQNIIDALLNDADKGKVDAEFANEIVAMVRTIIARLFGQ